MDPVEYIKERKKLDIPDAEIRKELENLNIDRNLINNAFDELYKPDQQEEHTEKKGFGVLLAIPLLLSIFAIIYVFGLDMAVVMFIASVIVLVKCVVYSFAIYLIILMSDFKHSKSYKTCFFGAVFIVLFTFIQVPFYRYLVVAFAAMMVIVVLLDTTIQQTLAFIFFIVFAEVFFSFGLTAVDDYLQTDKISVAQKIYCTMRQEPDISRANSIETNTGIFRDTCTVKRSIDPQYFSNNCSDCFIIEYSCDLLETQTNIYNCTNCIDGACRPNDINTP